MKNCPNCNAQLQDHDLFCGECGAKFPAEPSLEEPVSQEPCFCSQCGQVMEHDAMFCPECGAAVSCDAPEIENEPVGKKKTGKAFLIGGIVLFALLAVVVTVFLLFAGKHNTKYVAYVKDGEIWFGYFSEKPFEVTSKLLDTDSISKEKLAYLNNYPSVVTYGQVSADGKRIFFPDKVTDDGMNLYYQDLSDSDSAAVKISSDVTSYFINDKGDRIFYNKNDSIYLGPVDQPQKVTGEIGGVVAVDEKFQSIVYYELERIENEKEVREEYTYYFWSDGKKEKLVSGEVGSFFVMDKPADCRLNQLLDGAGMQTGPRRIVYQSLTQFCYVKDDVLSVCKVGGKTEKIDSEVSSIAAVYPTGEIFYIKKDDPVKYVDYIQNADALDLSEDYKDRNMMTPKRLWLSHDGSKWQIAENCSFVYFAPKKPVAVLGSLDFESMKKVEITAEMGFYEACNMLDKSLRQTGSVSIVTDGVACETDLKDVYCYVLTNDGSAAYFLCVGKEKVKDDSGAETDQETYKEEGDIYHIAIKEGSIETAELYDSEVSGSTISLTGKDALIYYKDYDKEKQNATLVVDRKEIDFDVRPGSVRALENGGYIYYIDYNSDEEKLCGTLRIFQNDVAQTVADDVCAFAITPDNEILYLQDYDVERSKGDLYRYNKGKHEKIDSDVIALLDIYLYDKILRSSMMCFWKL